MQDQSVTTQRHHEKPPVRSLAGLVSEASPLDDFSSGLPDGVDPSWPPPRLPASPPAETAKSILEGLGPQPGATQQDIVQSPHAHKLAPSVFDQPPVEVSLKPRSDSDPKRVDSPAFRSWDSPNSTPELRQVAGLTAGMALPLDLRSYTFSDRSTETGFAISVVGQQVLVTPGASEARIDGHRVVESTTLGNSVLDVGTACFLAVPHNNHRATDEWLAEEALYSHPEPILEIPPGLSLESGDQPNNSDAGSSKSPKRRWGRSKRAKKRSQERPIDLVTKDFLEQIRQHRSRAEARQRYLLPDPAELQVRARAKAPTLRSRGLDSPQFAQVGVMWADKQWSPRFSNPNLIPSRLSTQLEPLMLLRSVPVAADPTLGPIGIVGPRNAAIACVRNLMVSLFALSNSQLSLHVAAPRNMVHEWNWAAPIARSAESLPETGFPVVVLDGLKMFDEVGLNHQHILEHRIGLVVIAESVQDLPQYSSTVLQIDTESPALMTNHLGNLTRGIPVGITEELANSLIRELLAH